MVKKKQGFNWKARQQSETIVDKSAEAKIQVDLLDQETEKGFDDSNVLALPSKKRDSKKKHEHQTKVKRLTKKERRKLEKVVEIKDKKAKRSEILESLAAHQASSAEMKQLISISEVMSGKLKRKHDDVVSTDMSVNTIAGSNKRRRRKRVEEEVESSDSEESIHTSDMSSDEEYPPGEISQQLGEIKSETKSDASKEMNNGGEIVNNNVQHTEHCDSDEIVTIEVNNSIGSKPSSTDNKSKSQVENIKRTKHHARGTSGNWVVSEFSTNKQNKVDSSKTDPESISNKKIKPETVCNKTPQNNKDGLKKQSTESIKKTEVKGTPVLASKVINIPVNRDQKIQDGRLKLPILGEEQIIMEAISENPVVIICGETGSGKTTQVPQFLYEAGYAHGTGIIGVTEPRRVAAVSMSTRVATEMSLKSSEVSYQIRYEGNVTPDTKIKFMTDGVLLKEVQKDFLLSKYTAVIIDEAHERSVYTDILIGLLSRIVPLRQKRGNPLKLIIMSATLRVEDFTENKKLFKITPPVIKVDARQFPVTIHYNKRTPLEDYLTETLRKVCKIHRRLPEGGILVFVTGQQEVHTLCKKLKKSYPLQTQSGESAGHIWHEKRYNKTSGKKEEASQLPKISLDNYSVSPLDDEEEQEGDLSGDLDLDDDNDLGNHSDGSKQEDESEAVADCSQPMYVLPLYSLLSTDRQRKVFGPVPEGCRLCVVATNVAETSLTIPGIKYVVDTGKMKTKLYDKVTGVSTFKITWSSKASADQRAGRAGRVAPGHCYRLFSSAVFNDEFEKFSPAEITRRPVDDLVLQMKDMNIEKVINFPYPTAPDREQIQAAERLLVSLGALTPPPAPKSFKDIQKDSGPTITSLGRAMASFPVNPRYSKMLAVGQQHDLLAYVVVIVSALSVQELFEEVHSNLEQDEADDFKQRLLHLTDVKRRWAADGNSLLLGDLMVMLKAVGSCEFEGCTAAFCEKYGMRMKAIREVKKLRHQLTNSVNLAMPDANICVDPQMAPPSDVQAKLLRQIVLSGMGDHVARKLPEMPSTSADAKKLRHAYVCPDLEDPVFIHPTSILYKHKPEWIVFQHIEETSKLYMKGITAIEPEWLPLFASSHVTLSKPMEDPPPRYDQERGQVMCKMTGTFGHRAWSLPAVELEYPMGVDKMKWFARFLLQGDVVPGLKKYTPSLLSQPATMVKSWAKLQPRTESLLRSLLSERVESKHTLLEVWKKQPNYLLSALMEWIPEARHMELTTSWPPTQQK